MNSPTLYRGVWPQNVSKLAKYGVKWDKGAWKPAVTYEAGSGLTALLVEGRTSDLVERINAVRGAVGQGPGGPFYINEYRHVLVPVAAPPDAGTGSLYYCVGAHPGEFRFEFEGQILTTRPVNGGGFPLKPGDRWTGPRPGIPYVLAAGASDIYYETPALTEFNPPAVRPRVTRKVQLSRVLNDKTKLTSAIRPIVAVRGHQGGRFYVNEHHSIFSPVGAGDGNGIEYIYCGQIDLGAWFPEPAL